MAVLAASGGDDHATLTLGYDFDGTDAGYPFLLRVNVTYSLHEADAAHGRPARFGVTTSVRNAMAAQPLVCRWARMAETGEPPMLLSEFVAQHMNGYAEQIPMRHYTSFYASHKSSP